MQTLTNGSGVPRWYWGVSIAAILWMLFGVIAWVSDFMMTEATLAQMPDAQRQLYELRPQWLFAVYGIAIASGFLGTVALLLRNRRAVFAFAVSLVAIVVQFGYMFLVLDAIGRLGAAAALPFPLLIFAIGVALLWLSLVAKTKGWLR